MMKPCIDLHMPTVYMCTCMLGTFHVNVAVLYYPTVHPTATFNMKCSYSLYIYTLMKFAKLYYASFDIEGKSVMFLQYKDQFTGWQVKLIMESKFMKTPKHGELYTHCNMLSRLHPVSMIKIIFNI